MYLDRIKYLVAFLPHVGLLFSIEMYGIHTWVSLFYMFIVLPVLEMVIGEWKHNYTSEELSRLNRDKWYDLLLYILVPLQYVMLFLFLRHITEEPNTTLEYIGHVSAMGILSGTIAINVAHELGHRTGSFDRFLAKTLLLSTSYMHFYVEHNRGHHKNVSTVEDPATARFNENLYVFLVRSMIFSYLSAWRLERERMKKMGNGLFHWKNEALRFAIIQVAFMGLIWWIFGWSGVIGFMISSIIGIVLLENVNYIQHYGLARNKKQNGAYEQVTQHHSWNSGYPIGQILLFQLGRHSDHHHKANKKYQTLDFTEDSPQMPTGYTGMIVMSMLPPLWYKVMNPLVKKYTRASG